MSKNELNFTKQSLSNLPTPSNGKRIYKRDIKERGLTLCKTHTNKISFYLRKMVDGKDGRILIGHYPEISIENARKKTLGLKGSIAQGNNPQEDKNKLRQEINFGELWIKYINLHSKAHKKSWQEDEDYYRRHLQKFKNVKISAISKTDIAELHSKTSQNNGIYVANKLLAIVSVVFNKAISWGWQGENPATHIKKFKEKSRDRFLQASELPRFFKALDEETNLVTRDYVWFSILTGARKSNILSMNWQDIDFDSNIWRIPDTKNGEPLNVYLPPKAIEILQNRKMINKQLDLQDFQKQWVLPSLVSKSGHLEDPKKAWKKLLTRANIDNLRIHDLRRTLGSWQASLGSSLQIIGKSLGQKSIKSTQIYSRLNIDPIKLSVDRAIYKMLEVGNG
jgi:integrase